MNKAEERYQEIIAILKKNPIVTVSDFSERLSVSTETIRKDLNVLAEQGKIVRVHGGAALSGETSLSTAFQFREGVRRREKRMLGLAAAELIHPGNSLLIENSTTNVEFVKVLLERPELLATLQIVTNSAHILTLLRMGRLCKKLFFLGGQVNRDEEATKGSLMLSQLSGFHVDQCILSGAALGKSLVLSSYYESDMLFQKQSMALAETSVLLLEAGKYPEAAVFSVAPVTAFDCFVTNIELAETEKEKLMKARTKLIYVKTELG